MFFDIKKSDRFFMLYNTGDAYANTVFCFFSTPMRRVWLHLSRSSIYDNEGSIKIYFHIEEYQGDAYVFNLRVIREDIISFYETFESSFCRYEARNVSWAELGPYRRG